ncbi:MAG: hypothetical protein DI586_09325 [Micavibrio aeruginosavorus]|uniref:O-antigen ligase-related domain-containing protein n=1 Tax=Micavibrio aeruginosavorus TaxID=349221 RepID=A0A2W5HLG3_9BACT|nr:MAG: hypothetical protein DI586_09325 [Micavibrio aeruginosavorus]
MTLSYSTAATGLWLLAFIFSFTWMEEFQSEFFIGTLACLFAAMAVNDAGGIKQREWKFHASPVLVAGGLFWAVAGISLAASDILFTSWIYFFFFSVLPLTIVFFLVGGEFDRRLEMASIGIRYVLGVLSLYVLWQYFCAPTMLYNGRVHEPLTDPNGLAAVLSIGVFLALSSVLRKSSRIDTFLLLCILAAFLTTGSRGAFLAIAIAGISFILSIGIHRIGKRSWLLLSSVAALAVITTGVVYAPTNYSGPLKVLSYTMDASFDGVFNERGLIWESAWQLVKTHPWFGTGPGTFPFYYPEVRQIGDNTAGLMVHNDPLQFAVEMGVFSAVLFYAICAFAMIRSYQAIRKKGLNNDLRIRILAPLFALLAFVLHAHVTFNFYVLPGLMLAGFLFSIWYRATAEALIEHPRNVSAPVFMNDLALKTLFMIVAIVMFVLVASPIYSQKLVTSAQKDLQGGHLEAFAHKVDTANTMSLGTNADAYVLAANIPLGVLDQAETSIPQKDRADFIAQAESLLARAEKANPRDADIYMLRSQLAKVQGRQEERQALLEKTLRLNPAHMAARIELSDYLDAQGKVEDAVKLMSEGIDIKYGRDDAVNYMNFYLKSKAMEVRLEEIKAKSSPKVP